jgi:hypothetical protein
VKRKHRAEAKEKKEADKKRMKLLCDEDERFLEFYGSKSDLSQR